MAELALPKLGHSVEQVVPEADLPMAWLDHYITSGKSVLEGKSTKVDYDKEIDRA